jgi:hypothetical protein
MKKGKLKLIGLALITAGIAWIAAIQGMATMMPSEPVDLALHDTYQVEVDVRYGHFIGLPLGLLGGGLMFLGRKQKSGDYIRPGVGFGLLAAAVLMGLAQVQASWAERQMRDDPVYSKFKPPPPYLGIMAGIYGALGASMFIPRPKRHLSWDVSGNR